ncbi:MAG: hypothetical protein V3573_14400 [Desulfovibrionaceae bacterium]
MSARKVSIPPVPAGLDPELRRFLDSIRTYLLTRDGQTGVARADDKTLITKRDMREILPGLVEMLLKERGL